MSFTLRPVNPSDTNWLTGLWPARDAAAVQELLRRIQTLAQRKRGQGVVVECNAVPCGFALLTLWPSVAEISDLAVLPAYRRRGVGTALINHLVSLARHEAYTVVEIGVMDTNQAARRLYQRLGFQPQRTVRLHGNGHQKVIYLQKQLVPENDP